MVVTLRAASFIALTPDHRIIIKIITYNFLVFGADSLSCFLRFAPPALIAAVVDLRFILHFRRTNDTNLKFLLTFWFSLFELCNSVRKFVCRTVRQKEGSGRVRPHQHNCFYWIVDFYYYSLDSPCKAGALALFHFGAIISDYCQHQVSISTYVTKRHVLTKVGPSMQFLIFSNFFKKSVKKLSKTGDQMRLVSMANVILGGLFFGTLQNQVPNYRWTTDVSPLSYPLRKKWL